MMIGALRRSSGFSGLLHFRHFSQLNGSKTFEATAILRKQSQSQPIRPYFRFPDSFRKTKDFGVSPSLLSSSLSLFSSILKVEFLEWYLAMVKCRPVLTKSVTSALIYTAADLSSQVNDFRACNCVHDMFIAVESICFWVRFVGLC